MNGQSIKWGIIGCGDVTEIKSGPAFYTIPGSELKAVMRRDASKAEDYAHRHHVDKWYHSVDDLLSDQEIDAIYIATPPASHAELTIAALNSKRPVYVEKPMAMNYSQCRKMIDSAQANNRPLFVAFYRRSLPYFQKVKEILASGKLGKILHIESKIVKPLFPGDDDGSIWRVHPEISGGGYFVDLAPHQLDLLIHWFGLPISQTQHVENKTEKYRAEDFVELQLQFSSQISYMGLWCFNASETCDEDSFTIIGTEGKLQFSTFTMTPILLKTSSLTVEIPFERPKTVQQPHIENIINRLLNHEDSIPSSTYEAAEVTKIIEDTLKEYYHEG